MMENKVINQKEYLKKYTLGDGNEKKKKKKKKHKTGVKTVKIVDDDIDFKNMRPIEEGEFDILLEGEDAPQIAGIVDERGPVDFTDKRRWKIITENDGGDLTVINRTVDKETRNLDETSAGRININDNLDLSPPRAKHSRNKRMDSSPQGRPRDDSSDLSPPRSKRSKNKRADVSPDERSKGNGSDLSPPRHKHSKDKHIGSRRRSKNDDSDLSPPRQSKNYDSDLSPPRQSRNNDSDLSPPRQSRNNDSDLSPPRKSKNYDSDLSPPRSTKHRTSARSTSGRSYRSSGNRDSDSDFSPPRKNRKQNLDTDLYESRKNTKSRDSDLSTSRRNDRSRRDNSPRSNLRRDDRRHDYHDKKSSSRSGRQDVSRSSRDKRENKHEDRDRNSRSYSDTRERRKKSRWDDETDDSERGHTGSHSKNPDSRATKTLDGKTAGFQAAKALREETEAHKRREVEHFKKLSKEITGEGQATIVRDKMGRKRNLEAEAEEKREEEMKQREINQKYGKWGKGLKQVQDHEKKLKDDLYEMNKPLARYADDADLDEQLRAREREGDTMLKYIKQKQIKEGKRKPDPPQYQGLHASNRFGIKPGHRWDGVDRSNGYEKQWFESQNAKVALKEEAYKWSTADM